jgi:hypothetical protein
MRYSKADEILEWLGGEAAEGAPETEHEALGVLEWLASGSAPSAPQAEAPEARPEDVVGQLRIGRTQLVVTPRTTAPIHSAATLDAALAHPIAERGRHALVRGGLFTGGSRFDVYLWGAGERLPTPPVVELDIAPDAAAISINGGEAVYVPSNTPLPVLRWVRIPRLRELYALPPEQQRIHRDRWTRRLAAARTSFTRAQLEAMSSPALRVLAATSAGGAFPVTPVRRGSPAKDRGGVVHGVSVPLLRLPLVEPECYLPVIAEAEGRLESINAWDAGAGISLGPIQFNVQRAALFRFLRSVWELDRDLFAREFGTPLGWSMQLDGDHWDLVVGAGPGAVLHGRATESDIRRNVGYFQAGAPGASGFDAEFRRRVAERFRNIVVWPHVQEWIIETSAWWLEPGLAMIHREGIPPLDRRTPEPEVFVLKAMLLSAYVRFSGCLAPLLTQLRQWPTVGEKLANWRTALAATPTVCRGLQARLTAQESDAARVFRVVSTLRAATGEAAVLDVEDACEAPHPGSEGLEGTARVGAEAEAVPDPTVAIPPFSAAKRSAIRSPLLSAARNAAAVEWNQRAHPSSSGVNPADIQRELDRYIDRAAVAAAVIAHDAANPGRRIASGSPSAETVHAEMIHQFQAACFADPRQADGKAGESTLDSLGLVTRTGLNSVDQPNARALERLRRVAGRVASDTRAEFTHSTWYSHMVNPTFLGHRFHNGIHVVLARKLRIAERHLLTLPSYAGLTPVELGRALGISEEHKGARPTAATASMHTFGLAVDIRYGGNPWIAGQHVDRDASGPSPVGQVTIAANRAFIRAANRAALLISGVQVDVTSAFLHRLSRRSTGDAYDELFRRDADLRAYLRAGADRPALEARILERQRAATPGVLNAGEPPAAAAERWARLIATDLADLSLGPTRARNARGDEVSVAQSNFTGRDPRNGFLNLHRDLVLALRDAAGLAWAAIDIGPSESGDVMHFDDRRAGIGKTLYES